MKDNLLNFGPGILQFFAGISDTPLFRSLVNNNHQTIMTLLKKIYSNLGEQQPELSKYIEMIIKNNGEKNLPSKVKNKEPEPGFNEADMIGKGVINRKFDDARMYMYDKQQKRGDG